MINVKSLVFLSCSLPLPIFCTLFNSSHRLIYTSNIWSLTFTLMSSLSTHHFGLLNFFFNFVQHCPTYTLNPCCPLSLYTSLLSGCSRGVSHLLAAFLCDSHSEHPLQDMLRASRALQCFHLAGVCQQCPQSYYLHHLQHRVQTGLHQDPQLLRKTGRQEMKMRHSCYNLDVVHLVNSDHRCMIVIVKTRNYALCRIQSYTTAARWSMKMSRCYGVQ